MFSPNSTGQLANLTGRDIHARPTFTPDYDIPFAPVSLLIGAQKTSVRADSSASRGNSEEIVSTRAKILVPTIVTIAIGDRFKFRGSTYLIAACHERYSVAGDLDHFECDMEILPA